MIMTVTGLDRKTAGELLERAGGHVKTALVMHAKGIEHAEAERLLAEHGGHVARILKARAE
jgi:N-acetylmuramic acid 6-phosphate etherase